MGLLIHLLLFLVLSFPIVTMAAFYAEPEDGPALRALPKRYAVFVGACALVSLVMLLLESIFVSVS